MQITKIIINSTKTNKVNPQTLDFMDYGINQIKDRICLIHADPEVLDVFYKICTMQYLGLNGQICFKISENEAAILSDHTTHSVGNGQIRTTRLDPKFYICSGLSNKDGINLLNREKIIPLHVYKQDQVSDFISKSDELRERNDIQLILFTNSEEQASENFDQDDIYYIE